MTSKASSWEPWCCQSGPLPDPEPHNDPILDVVSLPAGLPLLFLLAAKLLLKFTSSLAVARSHLEYPLKVLRSDTHAGCCISYSWLAVDLSARGETATEVHPLTTLPFRKFVPFRTVPRKPLSAQAKKNVGVGSPPPP